MSETTSNMVGPEQAAVRKVIYGLAELNGQEADPDDVSLIEAARQGLENLEDIHDRLENVEAETEVLQERAPSPAQKEYQQMDRADKATVVCSKMRREAESTTGTAKASYKDVVRMFDGHPSAGHAYDIMETAANEDGFNLGTDPEGKKRLTFSKGRV